MRTDFSREPSDYRPDPNGHLRRRKSERKVPGDAIAECIRNGEPVPSEDDGIRLRAKYGAITYWVVIEPDTGIVKSCGTGGS